MEILRIVGDSPFNSITLFLVSFFWSPHLFFCVEIFLVSTPEILPGVFSCPGWAQAQGVSIRVVTSWLLAVPWAKPGRSLAFMRSSRRDKKRWPKLSVGSAMAGTNTPRKLCTD